MSGNTSNPRILSESARSPLSTASLRSQAAGMNGSTPPENSSSVDPIATSGAILFGGLATTLLYGITVLQTFLYYLRSYQLDGWLMRVVVFGLWISDTLGTAFIWHALYVFFVLSPSGPSPMSELPWSVNANLLLTTVMGALVRSMYVLRVWKFSSKKLSYTLLVGSMTLLSFAFGIVVGVKTFNQTFNQHGQDKFSNRSNSLAFVALWFTTSKFYVNSYLAMLNARQSMRRQMNQVSFTVHLSQAQAVTLALNNVLTTRRDAASTTNSAAMANFVPHSRVNRR
ncbi:hypothetical protein PsYK624_049560 [Phanerochaete sordida]|uniref:Uncharacterized protein n=1 Tax=Phanerochaete sordida TaxID=48140 RepID=A0A9P3LBT4_9APHY|nr:hypothetical protein PsYK624_049560 [Phanerochaete sordida]